MAESLLAVRDCIWVGVCGEMASNTQAVPLLVGMGVDELSMSASVIPEIKSIIRSLGYENMRQLVVPALDLETAEEVRAFLRTNVA